MTDQRLILGRTVDRSPLAIDLDRLLVTRLLVQGSSGSGKSRTLRRLLEVTFGHVQHIVIDIEGEFHTLREKFDYILAAKEGGDCPADCKSAHLLAQRILELGTSAIVDIYELHPEERAEFVQLFIESLMQAPKKLWHPVLIVIDEAQRFCPESGNKELKPVIAAVKDLMGRGRKRGFSPVLAVQRLSDLDKTAAAECLNKLIGRTSLDVDRARAGKELGFIGNDNLKLRDLDDGHFFAFGPALSRDVTQILVDDVVTTHPRPGQRSSVQTATPERIKAVLAQLASIPHEAEHEAHTIEELEIQNHQLRHELQEARSGVPDSESVRDLVADAEARLKVAWRREAEVYGSINKERGELLRKIVDLATVTDYPAPISLSINQVPENPIPASQHRPVAPPAAGRVTPFPRDSRTAKTSKLAKSERAILLAIAQMNRIQTGPCSRIQASIVSGYSVTSSSFSNALSALRAAGFLTGVGDASFASPAGVDELGHIPPVPSGRALLQFWEGKLGKAERSMLDAIVGRSQLSKDKLSEVTGYSLTSSSFSNALSRLRSLGLIHGKDPIVASRLFQ